MMGFGFLGMLLFWGLFLALVVGGMVWLVRQSRLPGGTSGKTARQILDERLARGEITPEEYETIRAKLAE
ncbi:MAG: SHOCT domain-containing protein [Thermoflexales bacterium]|nr:SHOCT domain-containing protein [Thermoflexales bacterium]